MHHAESSRCFQIVTTELSWTDARKQCSDRGGDLAIVRSDALRNRLAENVKQWVFLFVRGARTGPPYMLQSFSGYILSEFVSFWRYKKPFYFTFSSLIRYLNTLCSQCIPVDYTTAYFYCETRGAPTEKYSSAKREKLSDMRTVVPVCTTLSWLEGKETLWGTTDTQNRFWTSNHKALVLIWGMKSVIFLPLSLPLSLSC